MRAVQRRRLRDARMPHLDVAAALEGVGRPASRSAASKLVGLHGDLDAARATL